MIIIRILVLVFLLGTWNSCKKDKDKDISGASEKTIDQLLIDRFFNWSMTKNVSLSVKADSAGNPLSFVPFKVYSTNNSSGELLMFSGASYYDEPYKTPLFLPIITDNITITTEYNNVLDKQTIPIMDVLETTFKELGSNISRPDVDKDRIPDSFDDYPFDSLKAFNNFFPGKNEFGALVFEDSWPASGDYDFNDLVVNYRFNLVTNYENKVGQIIITLVCEAMGTIKHNGFGFQLNLNTSLFKSVSGARLKHDLIDVDTKGFESGQRKAVVIAFDDASDMFLPTTGGKMTNTVPGSTYVIPDTLVISINLNDSVPLPIDVLGIPPFNPFIFVNGERPREIHLADYLPTDKADSTLFGTSSDNSKPNILRFYKSRNNLPWALNIPRKFRYLKEGEPINRAYLKFNVWAESSGGVYNDWYINPAQEYRDNSWIYSH